MWLDVVAAPAAWLVGWIKLKQQPTKQTPRAAAEYLLALQPYIFHEHFCIPPQHSSTQTISLIAELF
jgi:hypothetical protein